MSPSRKAPPVEEDPILAEIPVVEIAGHTYPVRRLGLRDVFKVARILGGGIAVLGDVGGDISAGQIAQIFVASMTRNEDEVLALLASVLGVDRKDLDDPEVFPMDSLVDVFAVLAEHQDLRAFLSKVQGLMAKLPEMQTA